MFRFSEIYIFKNIKPGLSADRTTFKRPVLRRSFSMQLTNLLCTKRQYFIFEVAANSKEIAGKS